ncbi:hypothetical protein C478_07462 [Natrinema thermotolerans DSM 11552]|nr:hypothetical protein C478_07462 [Natrinema thermotolerans DSM 11552]
MSADTITTPDHLDPVQYLPTAADARERGIPERALDLAEDILNATFPAAKYAGARRSALAGAALYAATAAFVGRDVSQDTVGDATGTTPVSIRSWMHDMAALAVEEESVDVAVYCESVGELRGVWERLQYLTGGGGIPGLPVDA